MKQIPHSLIIEAENRISYLKDRLDLLEAEAALAKEFGNEELYAIKSKDIEFCKKLLALAKSDLEYWDSTWAY